LSVIGTGEKVPKPPVRLDRDNRQATRCLLKSESRAQNLACRHVICARAPPFDCSDGGGKVFLVQFHPLTAQPDEWLLEARQLT
jgi:hypothetical protein